MRGAAACMLVGLTSLACGGAGNVQLTLEASRAGEPLRIPEDVDRLTLRVTVPGSDPERTVLDTAYPPFNPARGAFPVTITLVADDLSLRRLRVAAAAYRAELPVGQAEVIAEVRPREVTEVTLKLTP